MIYEKITLNNTSTYWLCWLLTSRISHATFAIDCKMTSEWMTLLQEVIYTGWRKSSRMSMVCKNSKIKKITTLSKCSMMDKKNIYYTSVKYILTDSFSIGVIINVFKSTSCFVTKSADSTAIIFFANPWIFSASVTFSRVLLSISPFDLLKR